jgi:hypothetical protein
MDGRGNRAWLETLSGHRRNSSFLSGDAEEFEQPRGRDAVDLADPDHPAGKLVVLGE